MDERCMSCGRGTQAGTPLFSGRRRGRDTTSGAEGFLCHACQSGSAGPGGESTTPLSGRYVVIDLPGGFPGH